MVSSPGGQRLQTDWQRVRPHDDNAQAGRLERAPLELWRGALLGSQRMAIEWPIIGARCEAVNAAVHAKNM
jgi:hypothetical protein